ncbi:MAG: RagB/SusD family nutrient uptake outer membrane protein, partial [Muribaculaceae bacterium]|nr:RagB/SusD family nutrient uptake outer membrane protein [Muribaculaceae bacterium]
AYLESCRGSKDAMRELIRNERRIELCFEGKRFWDLRRWKADLNETARGVRITGSDAAPVYEYIDVEARKYDPYMVYGPIPYGETVKFSNLLQNDGWK